MQASNSTRRFVIALGGNAILPVGKRGTFDEQVEITRETMDQVAQLVEDYELDRWDALVTRAAQRRGGCLTER